MRVRTAHRIMEGRQWWGIGVHTYGLEGQYTREGNIPGHEGHARHTNKSDREQGILGHMTRIQGRQVVMVGWFLYS